MNDYSNYILKIKSYVSKKQVIEICERITDFTNCHFIYLSFTKDNKELETDWEIDFSRIKWKNWQEDITVLKNEYPNIRFYIEYN